MRNKILFLTALACVLLSCKREEAENVALTAPLYSFKAEIAQDYIPEDLKSAVNLSDGASAFEVGDEVYINDGSKSGIYRYDGSRFNLASGEAVSALYASSFFPASMVASVGENKSFRLDIPAGQVYTTSTLSNPPMYGRFLSDMNTFRFYNLCTILKVSASDGTATSGKTISAVRFLSHEAGIAGAATYADGKLVMADDAEKSLSVTGSPSSVGSPTDWYILLPSQAYPGGFELCIEFTNGTSYTYSTTHNITLLPGYISAMEAFTCQYFSGGSGSEANPYRIANKADLLDMRTKITSSGTTTQFRDKHYILTADIDFENGYLGTIGTETYPETSQPHQHFSGSFDGQGHTISNVRFTRTQTNPRCGLFGTLDGGTIRRLTVTGAKMADTRKGRYAAILAARAINGALIEDCHVRSSTVVSDSTAVGIVAGELSGSVIRNCTVTDAGITGAGGNGSYGVGGLVGILDGSDASTVSGCSFSGSVTVIANTYAGDSQAHHAGGLVGYCSYTIGTVIEDCSFSGTLTSAGGAVGGIAGHMNGNTCIRRCEVLSGSSVEGGDGFNNVGGIVGYVGSRTSGRSMGEITACTFRGSLTGKGVQTGGIAGWDADIPVRDCVVENAAVSGGQNTGGAFGVLKDQYASHVLVRSSTVNISASTGAGIVASLQGSAEVLDCATEGTSIISSHNTGANDTAANTGGIAGWVGGGTTSAPSRIVRCHTTGGSLTTIGRRAGGIAGVLAAPSLVDECWSDLTISTTKGHAGGIVGSFEGGREDFLVINCTYFGDSVSESTNTNGAVAGIVGSVAYAYSTGAIQNGYVVNCFANPGSVSTGQYAAGGIGGYLCRHILDNCYSPIPASAITTGSSSPNHKGSVVGTMRRGGRIVNCYYLFQGSGSHDTSTDAGSVVEDIWKLTQLTDDQMKAASASVTIPSTGATAASLTDALNQGAAYYNNGGDGVAHHGSPKYGIRAKSWAKGSSYPYPTLVGSPLCDASEDDYARTVTVTDPNLTIYLPPKSSSNGKLVIVVPGGGYHYLAHVTGYEGEGWASYYNDRGFACAVLRYTLPGGHCELPLADLENAILYVREHSASLHVNSVGVHGFSAGGHLASTGATHFTGAAKPDFQILFYPVITMGTGTHANSKTNFLGASPTDAMVTLYSNELQVSASTPKAFVMYYDSDGTVPPSSNGAAYVSALSTAGVSHTVKVFSGSTHGWNDSDTVDGKTARQHLTEWLGAL